MWIAICDDEKNIRELIASKVLKHYPEAEIIFFSSGEELLLSDKNIDILFLDIQMSGRNGKHLAHLFPRKVSYNRFVELEKEILFPLTIFITTVLMG